MEKLKDGRYIIMNSEWKKLYDQECGIFEKPDKYGICYDELWNRYKVVSNEEYKQIVAKNSFNEQEHKMYIVYQIKQEVFDKINSWDEVDLENDVEDYKEFDNEEAAIDCYQEDVERRGIKISNN